MSFANNILGTSKRASFQTAGGSIIKFRHPYLSGQLATESGTNATITAAINTVDISSSCKLDSEYFRAEQSMDSAKQVVLVDGSVVTITNDVQAGTITLQCIPTTGLVGSGDAIACFQLVQACKDSVGGLLYITEYLNGKAITTVYYGVSVANVPNKIKQGNDVPVYPVKLLYAGWIQAVSSADASVQSIWAAGNNAGVSAIFEQFGINAGDNTAASAVGDTVGDGTLDNASTVATGAIANYDARNLSSVKVGDANVAAVKTAASVAYATSKSVVLEAST